ncbi:MAG: hypothetical protein D6706_11290 [Chloroflexi bacterium]|nr:MAG: hypothetical protein D6706_11290 [Chloroflexota bacterium]
MFLTTWKFCCISVKKLLLHLSTKQTVRVAISAQIQLVFVILSLTMAACSIESPTSISGNPTFMPLSGSVFFPKQELVNGEWIRKTGEVTGELVEVNGCLRLNTSHDDVSYLIIWPPSYTLNASGDLIQIRDEAGQVVAHVGEVVHMSGGETMSLEGIAGVNKQLLQEIPPECSGPYWISGGIISNGSVN